MTNLLETERLRVEYGAFVALRDFEIHLGPGALLGLIGPNGAGKTTALKAISGLIPISAGRVRVMGLDVEPGQPAALSQIGFAPDTPPVYNELTVEDFLRFIGRAYKLRTQLVEERIGHWLDLLWLGDRRKTKVKTLSRGMRQRLTVARTLLPDPPVVLLDEPAAGLDPAGRVQFRKMLASLRDQGKALIVSSHILADLHEYCTHILIMEGGQVKNFGTVAQVVGGRPDDRCRYELTLSQASPDAGAILGQIPGVSAVEVHGRQLSFEFDHDEKAAAEVLRLLVSGGLPVARFAPQEHDLEQAYLRTGIRQVD